MKSTLLLLVGFYLLQCYSCTPGENDVESPVMEVLNSPNVITDTICGSPANNVMVLNDGDSLSIKLSLKDNDVLSQLKLDIHDNFDCHGHAQKTDDWNLQKLFDLSGSETILNISEAIPQHVTAGAYHLIISLLDASGNEAEPLYYSLKVLNKVDVLAPKISIVAPAESSIEVTKEQKIQFDWIMKDNAALNGSTNSKSVLKYKDQTSGNTFTIAELLVEDANEVFEKEFDYEYTIPKTWIVGGKYTIRIWGYDAVNNLSRPAEIELTVN